MEIRIRHFGATAEVHTSLTQMERIFDAELRRRLDDHPAFENIGELFLSPTTIHPIHAEPLKPGRSFDRSTNTYFSDAPVDYLDWVSEDWSDRARAFANGLREAVAQVAKTRLTPTERSLLLDAIAAAESGIAADPPDPIEPVGSIFLFKGKDGATLSVGHDAEISFLGPRYWDTVVEIPPSAARDYVGAMDFSKSEEPQMWKLYRKRDGVLAYREAWPHEGKVIEHYGVCGERGEARAHSAPSENEAKETLARLEKQARADGFAPIPPSKHATLVVEFPIDDDCASAIERRHELENTLSSLVGWLGLGHCDGGSIGSGSMEVFLIVVDFKRAKAALEPELAKIEPRYTRIYRPN